MLRRVTQKVKNIVAKGEISRNFFFCHYVFKKLSAAEASESVYVRERVNILIMLAFFKAQFYLSSPDLDKLERLVGQKSPPLNHRNAKNGLMSQLTL